MKIISISKMLNVMSILHNFCIYTPPGLNEKEMREVSAEHHTLHIAFKWLYVQAISIWPASECSCVQWHWAEGQQDSSAWLFSTLSADASQPGRLKISIAAHLPKNLITLLSVDWHLHWPIGSNMFSVAQSKIITQMSVFEPMSVVSIKVPEGVCSIKPRAIRLEKTRKLIHIIVT